ncbi:MAG TPA: hypothetical protein VJL80_09935 [Aeromicrobium sp.]|nr:hypothetical protein [Aeromicrobium sp.]HKY58346.1 hypothetical protein [Aeromicrobium sp.]
MSRSNFRRLRPDWLPRVAGLVVEHPDLEGLGVSHAIELAVMSA